MPINSTRNPNTTPPLPWNGCEVARRVLSLTRHILLGIPGPIHVDMIDVMIVRLQRE